MRRFRNGVSRVSRTTHGRECYVCESAGKGQGGRVRLKRLDANLSGRTRMIFFFFAGERPGAIFSLASCLRRLLLLVVHTLANRNVPIRGGLIEFPAAVLALDVIAGVASRRGR